MSCKVVPKKTYKILHYLLIPKLLSSNYMRQLNKEHAKYVKKTSKKVLKNIKF